MKGVGFWPAANHTAAVWIVHPTAVIRVVVPTWQIFLDEDNLFDTYVARKAVARRDLLKNASAEDITALQNFAQDMRTHMPQ